MPRVSTLVIFSYLPLWYFVSDAVQGVFQLLQVDESIAACVQLKKMRNILYNAWNIEKSKNVGAVSHNPETLYKNIVECSRYFKKYPSYFYLMTKPEKIGKYNYVFVLKIYLFMYSLLLPLFFFSGFQILSTVSQSIR